VESALLEHPAVMECAITAVPDEIRGQIVKATVVLTRDYAPSDDLVEELQDHVRKLTAPYKYPRILEFLPELPKTISGKIRRVEIREKDQENKGAET
jgi:acetyl-CoA synthetase